MQTKPKILVLFCGGTLVMEENKKGALATPNKSKSIQNLLNIEPNIKKIAKLEVEYVDNIDSTNMEPAHWDKMVDVISKNYDKYDGFVITHGTDTMAYTSSALSFALQNLGKPVVLTGAQIPGGKIETDARRNFVNAVRVATMDVAGVFLVFDEEIIRGSRASKVSESKLDAFETINQELLGEIRVDVRFHHDHLKRHKKKLKAMSGFEPRVLAITLVPGLTEEILENILDSDIKGIVLRGFGTGNVPSKHLSILKKARQKGIISVIDSQCLEGSTMMHIYEVSKQALDAGVIQAYDMSIEATTTKLMWALKHAKNYSEVERIMYKNYTGEINIDGKETSKRIIC